MPFFLCRPHNYILYLFTATKGMGLVHVLTGPDHLSALATLSANAGSGQAFWYGVRWGIGHSIGLVVVGSIFIFISNAGQGNDENGFIAIPEIVETVGESIVGLFMLALGGYSMIKAFQKWNNDTVDDEEMRHAMMYTSSFEDRDSVSDASRLTARAWGGRIPSQIERSKSDRSITSISHQRPDDTSPSNMRASIFQDDDDDDEDPPLPYTSGEGSLSLADAGGSYDRSMGIESHGHNHDQDPLPNMSDGVSKHFLSICIGIVHGVAGPGGVLGVIPAVQLHNLFLSVVYLGSFCVTSTFVMGAYAAGYGMCSSRLSANNRRFEFRMEMFSALLSVFVGLLWLTLLYMGKLHDFFP
jgi:hypothetical protein